MDEGSQDANYIIHGGYFLVFFNPIRPGGGGGGGGGKCPRRFQLLRASLILKYFQPDVATLTNIYLFLIN